MRTEYECDRISRTMENFEIEVRETRKIAEEANKLADKARNLAMIAYFLIGLYFGILITTIAFIIKLRH